MYVHSTDTNIFNKYSFPAALWAWLQDFRYTFYLHLQQNSSDINHSFTLLKATWCEESNV